MILTHWYTGSRSCWDCCLTACQVGALPIQGPAPMLPVLRTSAEGARRGSCSMLSWARNTWGGLYIHNEVIPTDCQSKLEGWVWRTAWQCFLCKINADEMRRCGYLMRSLLWRAVLSPRESTTKCCKRRRRDATSRGAAPVIYNTFTNVIVLSVSV